MKKEKILTYCIIIAAIGFIINGVLNISHKYSNIAVDENIIEDENFPNSIIRFSNQKINFGRVSNDTILKAKFKIYNVGKHILRIYNVNPECTCTDYSLSKSDIAVGDSALISLILNTKDKYGKTKVLTTIKTNTDDKMHLLTIMADVYDKHNE